MLAVVDTIALWLGLALLLAGTFLTADSNADHDPFGRLGQGVGGVGMASSALLKQEQEIDRKQDCYDRYGPELIDLYPSSTETALEAAQRRLRVAEARAQESDCLTDIDLLSLMGLSPDDLIRTGLLGAAAIVLGTLAAIVTDRLSKRTPAA